MEGRTLFQAKRGGYFSTPRRGYLPLPFWWKTPLSGRTGSLHKHQCIEQFIRHMGSAPERHRMVWTGRNLKDHRVPTPAMSREPSTTRAHSSSVTLYLNHVNYFYSCVTSHFPSMPQISAYFTLEYKMLLYFKLFDTSSTAHVEPNLQLFPSKCYITAFSHHPPIPLHRSLMDVHLSHSCHAGWDTLMIPWEYALWRKCGVSSENKVVFTCWSFFF